MINNQGIKSIGWMRRPGFTWDFQPHQPVSRWDVKPFDASLFYLMARAMEGIAVGHASISDEPTEEKYIKVDCERLKDIIGLCKDLGLRMSAMQASNMVGRFQRKAAPTYRARAAEFEVLQDRIQDEMKLVLFMHVPADRAAFYNQPELMGKEVNAKFPAVQFDVAEAGNCYASGRGTAVVFHLMRIMETGVQAFGTKLGVKLTDEKNWQNILDEIDKAIKVLPKTPRRVEMSQASANLYAVKLAWRNEVMHPKDTYTLEEADNLIRQVKIFMEQLATIV